MFKFCSKCTWMTTCWSWGSPQDNVHFWHQLEVQGSPRPPSDLIIPCKDPPNSLKAVIPSFQFITVKDINSNQPTEAWRIQERPTLGLFSYFLAVDSQTEPNFLCNHVWQYTQSIADKGNSPEPWCSEFLLGLCHTDMVTCFRGWPSDSSPSEHQTDITWS